MEKYYKIAKFFAVFTAIIIVTICLTYNYAIGPVSKNNDEIILEITDSHTYLSVAELLKEKNLIKSISFYKVYIKIFNPDKLYAGIYVLNESMGVKQIVDILSHENGYNDDITITFREGLNMRGITKLITENTNNTEEDVYRLLKDSSYLQELKNNYWFITDDIINEKLYYSLEGYLFPDTYNFLNKDVTVKEIFKKMLDEMNRKLLQYKEQIESSNYSIHKLLTLASMIELEGSTSSDRKGVAGVFYNRLENNWFLGSDVTTYYAEKIDDWKQGLTNNQLQACNNYNTRGTCFKGLPIGPISNPSLESIEAVINSTDHNYYYFVADCSGKTYFNYNQSGHDITILKLKRENNWCDN